MQDLDVAERANLTNRILRCLVEFAPGSEAFLRGSLSSNRADEYSDIDVLWEVPDEQFQSCIENIVVIVSRVQAVDSLRADPDFQHSEKRRLFFVRFEAIPLFWRLDLDVFAKSIRRDMSYDVNNPEARGGEWSPAESALANAVAAVKWHLRGNDEEAMQLLIRAYLRVGLNVPPSDIKELILYLTHGLQTADVKTKGLAGRIEHLVSEVF